MRRFILMLRNFFSPGLLYLLAVAAMLVAAQAIFAPQQGQAAIESRNVNYVPAKWTGVTPSSSDLIGVTASCAVAGNQTEITVSVENRSNVRTCIFPSHLVTTANVASPVAREANFDCRLLQSNQMDLPMFTSARDNSYAARCATDGLLMLPGDIYQARYTFMNRSDAEKFNVQVPQDCLQGTSGIQFIGFQCQANH